MKTVCWLMCVFLNGLAFADSSQQFAEIGDLELQSGEVIQDARIGYRTAGTLNPDKSNVIVLPSWHMGSAEHLFEYDYVGPGKQADTDLYYVIAIDALGNGVSSSPSNSELQPGKQYPSISITDMVHSQRELLTRHLGITHVRAIVGMSMGGMQALEWYGRFPVFMDKVISIEGSPKMTSFDLIQWRSHVDAIEMMQQAGISNQEIMSYVSQINLLTLWTPEYLVESVLPEDLDSYLTNIKAQGSRQDPDDYLLQTRAMIAHDVLGLEIYSKSSGWEITRNSLLMIGFDSDHMVNPGPAKALATLMGSPYVEISTVCGHMGTSCKAAEIEELVRTFLK